MEIYNQNKSLCSNPWQTVTNSAVINENVKVVGARTAEPMARSLPSSYILKLERKTGRKELVLVK